MGGGVDRDGAGPRLGDRDHRLPGTGYAGGSHLHGGTCARTEGARCNARRARWCRTNCPSRVRRLAQSVGLREDWHALGADVRLYVTRGGPRPQERCARRYPGCARLARPAAGTSLRRAASARRRDRGAGARSRLRVSPPPHHPLDHRQLDRVRHVTRRLHRCADGQAGQDHPAARGKALDPRAGGILCRDHRRLRDHLLE